MHSLPRKVPTRFPEDPEKIYKLIEDCRLGIHDISRTELDSDSNLPRFNMPLELGMFLGIQRARRGKKLSKSCLILDRERYRYQKFLSDIAGQDIAAHNSDARTLIVRVRDWLNNLHDGRLLPGGQAVAARYDKFQLELPAISKKLQLTLTELTFADYMNLILTWFKSQNDSR